MYFCDCLSGLGKSIRDEGITIVLEIKAQLTPGLCNLLLSDDFPWRGDGHKIRTSVVCKTGVGTEIWYFLHPLCLQFFPCIIFERYFHLPVESRTGSVYVDSSCLYSKVSEQWAGSYWFSYWKVFAGKVQNKYRFVSKSPWKSSPCWLVLCLDLKVVR